MPSHRQSVTLPVPLFQSLKRDADKKGITVSDIIRKILDEHFEAQEKVALKREMKAFRG